MMLLVKLFYRDKTMGMAQSDRIPWMPIKIKQCLTPFQRIFWVVNN